MPDPMVTREHVLFGRLAVMEGWTTMPEVDACLDKQRELESHNKVRRIGSIMVDRGYLTPEQVLAILTKQNKALLACTSCHVMVNIIQYNEGTTYHCRECMGDLSLVKNPDTLEVAYSVFSEKESPSNEILGEDQIVGQIIGGMKIEQRLGKGGMGTVYKARHLTLGRDVALKILAPALAANRQYVDRFIREARVVAQLEHENVVHVFDIGNEKGHRFISMEYVDGKNLDQIMEERKRLGTTEAIRIIIQICEGLTAAQEEGIIHRDIKPENILFTKKGIVKIADFGLATHMQDFSTHITQAGQIIGSPHFMSPEQCTGKPVDGRSDIYSLGATFYYMVTGRYAFDGQTPLSVMLQHQKEKLSSPKIYQPDLPEAVCYVIEKMMEKRPNHRYPTAEYLASDLKKILQGESPDLVMFADVKSELVEEKPEVPRPKRTAATHPERHHAPSRDLRAVIWPAITVAISMVMGLLLFESATSRSSLKAELHHISIGYSDTQKDLKQVRKERNKAQKDFDRALAIQAGQAKDMEETFYALIDGHMEEQPNRSDSNIRLLEAYHEAFPNTDRQAEIDTEIQRHQKTQAAYRKRAQAEKTLMEQVDQALQKKQFAVAFAAVDASSKDWQGQNAEAIITRERNKINTAFSDYFNTRMADIQSMIKKNQFTQALRAAENLAKFHVLERYPKKKESFDKTHKQIQQKIAKQRKQKARKGFSESTFEVMDLLNKRRYTDAKNLFQSMAYPGLQGKRLLGIIETSQACYMRAIENLSQGHIGRKLALSTQNGAKITGTLTHIDNDRVTLNQANEGTLSLSTSDLSTKTILAFAFEDTKQAPERTAMAKTLFCLADGDPELTRDYLKNIKQEDVEWITVYLNMLDVPTPDP